MGSNQTLGGEQGGAAAGTRARERPTAQGFVRLLAGGRKGRALYGPAPDGPSSFRPI